MRHTVSAAGRTAFPHENAGLTGRHEWGAGESGVLVLFGEPVGNSAWRTYAAELVFGCRVSWRLRLRRTTLRRLRRSVYACGGVMNHVS